MLAEFGDKTPSRRLLERYVSKPDETKFEFLAKTVIYTLVNIPMLELDKEAWRAYAPVVKAAVEAWEAA